MSGFIEGEDRHQATLFPERLDDYVAEDSAVRVIDVFIDDLDLSGLGFKMQPNVTGRPPYHPATLLKIYVYGYLNRVQSSRRLECEARRNVELMWLTGRLSQGQWRCHPPGMPRVRDAVPQAQPVCRCLRRHRWQQIQVGWLAGLVVRGGGFGLIVNIVVGILGAFVGKYIFAELGITVGSGLIATLVSATVGAVILVVIISLIRKLAN